MKQTRVWMVIVLAMLLAACAGLPGAKPDSVSPATPGGNAVPGAWVDWPVSSPEAQGIETSLLDAMEAAIAEQHLNVDSLLVIRGGHIVRETYYNGQTKNSLHEMYSVTKSFTAALVGLAIDQGKLDGVDGYAVDLLPGRDFDNGSEEKDAMTVEHLLTMSTGLHWVEGDPAYTNLYRSRDWVDEVMGLEMIAAPGERFNYCSGCSHVLSAIVQQQVGMDGVDYAKKYLLEPLGITDFRWERDGQGIPIGGWGLSISSRDMARLGYLYLHNGDWQGRQVISEEWVKASTRKHQEVSDGRLDYGYQWWIDEKNDAFAALGRGGQTIYVDPSLDLIVVFTANLPGNHDPLLDLIDALEEGMGD